MIFIVLNMTSGNETAWPPKTSIQDGMTGWPLGGSAHLPLMRSPTPSDFTSPVEQNHG